MNPLHSLFDWLLNASLRASVLTVVVFAIQWAFQRHLSPRWRYSVWLPVLIVLLAPVLPESPWSIESVFRSEPMPIGAIVPAAVVETNAMDPLPPTPSRPTLPATAAVDWSQLRLMTWALGAAALLLAGGASYLMVLIRFHKSRHGVSGDLMSQLDSISREVGLRHSPRVLMADAIQSPAVTGLLRPTLLLPAGFESKFTAAEIHFILQHELTHLKRHDLALNMLLCVLMALHWFNPLLWLAFFKARADREAACDAQVLEEATPQRRSEYGHALLKMEAAFAPLRLSLGFVGMIQRGAALRARICSIAVPVRTRPLVGVLTTTCMVGMTFLGVTQAEKSEAVSDAEHPLIAIKIQVLSFTNDTAWDFGGRFKKLDPTTDVGSAGWIELLSEEEFQTLLEKLQTQPEAALVSYPRLVTADGRETEIRSVVNQPIPNGRDNQGKDLITHMPVGYRGKFTPKSMQGGTVMMNVEFIDSKIIATEIVNGREYPVINRRAFSGSEELDPHVTLAHCAWEGYDWKNGKPGAYRPVVTFVTAEVLDSNDGGLPDGDFNNFAIGNSAFRPGDSIRISQVQRGKDFLNVTADYELGSAENANISLYVTTKNDHGPVETDPSQTARVAKGKGTVVLHHSHLRAGLPHMTFYHATNGKAFGGVYFGSVEEAKASQELDLKYLLDDASPAPGKSGAGTFQEDESKRLRAAKPRRYDLRKAVLRDVVRLLAEDAGLSLASLSEDHPANDRLVTIAKRASPFEVLETVCRANGLMLLFDGGIWHLRPADDPELIGKVYPRPTDIPVEVTVRDIRRVLGLSEKVAPDSEDDRAAQPNVNYLDAEDTLYITASRLQHQWLDGYFKGLRKRGR
ncbi:MAG: hypothetical protein KDK99_06645 [Verrucomicrobiales bacterium]|nr:hypothetical protein [Verrucomicrobiales bacterium]